METRITRRVSPTRPPADPAKLPRHSTYPPNKRREASDANANSKDGIR